MYAYVEHTNCYKCLSVHTSILHLSGAVEGNVSPLIHLAHVHQPRIRQWPFTSKAGAAAGCRGCSMYVSCMSSVFVGCVCLPHLLFQASGSPSPPSPSTMLAR